ncbi:peptidase M23-like protein [Scopulibacillus darangshiensis]|uniref:Peptidase M23-like protein n=1 Tax=Scopulibacillus darangshiensis TaxID=442528 RepID=A0A4R2ND68_9BACL|nr:M23 family metallopeptidase [Scopulibacillus darangshiensis]TCP19133.1 peptidase M23-like protein [Scopulibacillus darangshiensis]
MTKACIKTVFLLFLACLLFPHLSYGKESQNANQPKNRKALYLKTAAVTDIPWFVLAAADQYERNIRNMRSDLPDTDSLIGIHIDQIKWTGFLNPNRKDIDPFTISLFGGLGRDGNGDGKANPNDPEDMLFAYAAHLSEHGPGIENIKIALWDYYNRGKTVEMIAEMANVYKTFKKVDLSGHSFPVPLKYNYTFHSTWGARRGWGGLRIHEGTDIFADYGTPVKATAYGIVEMIGWNKFGGWRLGIRDPQNIYHYYAHLTRYEKGLKKGSAVQPGQVIGYVGSSGYGPKGTQGKFPPHLHYGMYKDNGKTEFSFDPYPYLRAWESQDRNKKK